IAEAGDPIAAGKAVWTYILGEGWDAQARPALIAQLEASAPTVAPHLRALLSNVVTSEDVRALNPPALYIHGGQSLSLYVSIYHHVGRARPNQPRLLVEDAGHAVYGQRAALVNEAVLEFLGG
ncbi:MAG TPA: alpha/beta hydrolase, partial [Dehalococcoidia bacterium]|nr:alpha/beta hydrolase [Dehalococcoidia bacterium]